MARFLKSTWSATKSSDAGCRAGPDDTTSKITWVPPGPVADDAGTVLETFDYYRFGLLMPQRNTAGANTLEKFTGHELDEEAGLNLFYAGARYLDPALGRWMSVDPKADDFPAWSPYNYTLNNLINMFDPDGLAPLGCPPYCGGATQAQIRGNYMRAVSRPSAESAKDIGKATMVAASVFVEPADWAMISSDWIQGKGSAWDALALLPLLPSKTDDAVRAGKKLFSKSEDVADVAKPRTTVLGKYPQYIEEANAIGGNRFDIPSDVWNKMSDAEKWTANKKFLDRAINRGDEIKLATPFNAETASGYFKREIEYLLDQGYKLSEDGTKIYK